MSSRPSLSEQLRVLQQRHESLKAELAALQRSRRSVQLRHALAVQWCEQMTLSRNVHQKLKQEQQQQGEEEDDAEGADARAAVQQLLEAEVSLLQELHDTAGAVSLAQLLQPNPSTIAPATDPMAVVRRLLLTQVQPKAAEAITARSHAQLLQQTALSLGIMLNQLQVLLPWERTEKLQEIAAVWDRYFQEQASLILLRQAHTIEEALCFNLETLQPDPEAAAKHQASQAAAMVPALDLQEQQEELIAAGVRLYVDTVAVIHAERQQLQAQMSQLEAQMSKLVPGSSSMDAGSSINTSNGSSAGGVIEHLGPRQEHLQRQQSLANRLPQLLRKEYALRSLVVGFLVGSLTLPQLSRVAVLSWPYGMRLLFVGTEVMQQREAREQQRQQLHLQAKAAAAKPSTQATNQHVQVLWLLWLCWGEGQTTHLLELAVV